MQRPLHFFTLLLTILTSLPSSLPLHIPPPPLPLPNNPHHLAPRTEYTIGHQGFTLHFQTSTALLPVQASATAMALWYSSVRERVYLSPHDPGYHTFNKRIVYATNSLAIIFTPLDPEFPGNLAMKTMAQAFVTWLVERAALGFVELFEASIWGPFGVLGVEMVVLRGGGSGTGASGN
ncbi:MAG: hypothetical protein HETSPECPRED_008468 [Heterodermia speciosa]|uniref:Uncharacterized protein n=1 Tax=Heterodermia speciosa TaxID=116794 RepID=A0A8H3IUJ7_9LECA|nr:MAG: hypothetical protein HETSPECPRED_008468 [Heterodermia speciosa]